MLPLDEDVATEAGATPIARDSVRRCANAALHREDLCQFVQDLLEREHLEAHVVVGTVGGVVQGRSRRASGWLQRTKKDLGLELAAMIVNDLLTDVEVRVLGSLIEKAMTTPDHYPLSLHALTNACNQSSNRHPVVQFDEEAVARAIESLRARTLVRAIKRHDSRVTKYQHLVADTMSLDAREAAVLCVLMLRGPQTIGELKSRSGRFADFASLADVETALNALIAREESPLVVRLPRRTGQKEVRFAHLLSGEVTFDAPDPTTMRVQADAERIGALEDATEELRKEVVDLRTQLEAFRKLFE